MLNLAYLSEVSPWWTIERQEAALADVLPLPNAQQFRDLLAVRERRAHQPGSLVERGKMLRPTMRPGQGDLIHVASLAVLAWSEEDMREVLAAIESLGAVLRSAEGFTGDPLTAWAAARRRSRLEGAALLGSAVSAKRRKAASLAAVATIRDLWPLPSKDHSTKALEVRSGLSLNTIKAHLGPRPIAQYKHKLKLARKARGARKEAQTDE